MPTGQARPRFRVERDAGLLVANVCVRFLCRWVGTFGPRATDPICTAGGTRVCAAPVGAGAVSLSIASRRGRRWRLHARPCNSGLALRCSPLASGDASEPRADTRMGRSPRRASHAGWAGMSLRPNGVVCIPHPLAHFPRPPGSMRAGSAICARMRINGQPIANDSIHGFRRRSNARDERGRCHVQSGLQRVHVRPRSTPLA